MRTAVHVDGEATASPLENPTLRDAIQRGAVRLSEAGIESSALDAEVLLRHTLQLEREEFYLRLHERLNPSGRDAFEKLLERRAAREPLAYITGEKEFWSLDFLVTPAVLIPRPETELLVELALDYAGELARGRRIKILDIGTGSGAIAVSLAKHLPESEVWAVDMASAALAIARANAERHNVEERMRFLRGDLFDALDGTGVRFDLIVSNPPYIRTAELAGLAPEIRDWEPLTALDGGADGLDCYRRLIGAAPLHLNEGGRILLEIGADLAEAVVGLFAGAGGYGPAGVQRDYAGRDRVVTAVKGARGG
jgi:release factor glutamine methyltransferase